tara:strand:- start:581 stop:820 length:240 start_codon:yes stop_codon:yes gene_type:complete
MPRISLPDEDMYFLVHLDENEPVNRRDLIEGDNEILARVYTIEHLRQLDEIGVISMKQETSSGDYTLRLTEKGGKIVYC